MLVDLQRHISAFISSPSPCVFKRQHHKITFNLKVLHQGDVTRAATTFFLQQRLVILHTYACISKYLMITYCSQLNATDLLDHQSDYIHIMESIVVLHYQTVQLGFLSLENGGLLSCGGDIEAGMYEH